MHNLCQDRDLGLVAQAAWQGYASSPCKGQQGRGLSASVKHECVSAHVYISACKAKIELEASPVA